MIEIGEKLPHAEVALMRGDALLVFDFPELLLGRTLVVGMPGAFTPVCSHSHLPSLITAAPELIKWVDQILVVTPDNPWVLDAWRQTMDAPEHMLFVSDGNAVFTAACGMTHLETGDFLGQCARRYALLVNDRTVERRWVEDSIYEVGATGGGALAEAARDWTSGIVSDLSRASVCE